MRRAASGSSTGSPKSSPVRPRTGDTKGTAGTTRLDGRVALVTGGASGIGRQTAIAFAQDGARVVVADIDREGGMRTVERIVASGGTAHFSATDVTRPEAVARMVADAVSAYGGIQFAVNASGTEGPRALAADITDADWDRTIALNLTGVWLCVREEVRVMRGRGGAIVNVSSVGGIAGYAGSSAYSASKHGVIGLTRSAAREYAPAGIRINAICPGAVETPMLDRVERDDPGARDRMRATKPLGRLASAEEIGRIAMWLCGDEAGYIVGQALVIDGGMLAGLG